ncbi:class I SAM-dependent methyltransferase [Winogradskyella sp. A2]|uniref:class I SAM-dependent methyltransferase n=1 Tax=Winogradskyella sp. A2 TaxID=3366944 RepID=UPI00398C3B3B
MDLKLNADRFTGSAYISTYDKFRPYPPKEIIQLAINYLGHSNNLSVVDLGCGSGISTFVWDGIATKIHGFDASEEMIEFALKHNTNQTISFNQAFSHAIPLKSNTIDIVSSSQSLHWMEPKSTFSEVNRLLKDKGVFLVYDVIWPLSLNTDYEMAYTELFKTVDKLTKNLNEEIAIRWDKTEHLQRIKDSNYFNYVKESYFHKSEPASKEKLIGIAMSQGGLEALIKKGFSSEACGIDKFITTVNEMENIPKEMIYNYRVIFAVNN